MMPFLQSQPIFPQQGETPAQLRERLQRADQLLNNAYAAVGGFLAAAFPHADAEARKLASALAEINSNSTRDSLDAIAEMESQREAFKEAQRLQLADPGRIKALLDDLQRAQADLDAAEAAIADLPENLQPMMRMATPFLRSRVQQLEGEISWQESQIAQNSEGA